MDAERKSIYVETTIPGYATSRPSNDIVIAGRQALTRFFWEQERHKYALVVSQDVLDECSLGNPEAAQRRLALIEGIESLVRPLGIDDLANNYQKLLGIPNDEKTDCYHLSYCVIEKIDYLLSWNCRHLGLASSEKIRYYNEEHGLWLPLLVTPEYFTTI
jgi:hypothetical protein